MDTLSANSFSAPSMNLDGLTAVVTGAGRGIGEG